MNFPTTEFPQLWDSTMLESLGCGFKTYLEYMHHYKLKGKSVHLHAGAAFAKGIEVAKRAFYDDKESAENAIRLGRAALELDYGDFDAGSSAKTLERMVGALDYYFAVYPLGVDPAVPIIGPNGKHEVEWSFCVPLPIRHPVSGEPLLYAGRFDGVCHWAGGEWGEDEKTTTSLGERWAKQWALRGQFTGYCWARRELGRPISGILVRGISILKTKYDHADIPSPRADWEIDRWIHNTCRKLDAAIKWWTEVQTYNVLPPMALDSKCNDYGGCPFRTVCLSPDPEPWLGTHYEKRVWNPLTRMETTLEKNDGEAET